MKKLTTLLLVSFLTVVLFSSQPAVIASTSSNAHSQPKLSAFDSSTPDFNVTITGLKASPTGDYLTPAEGTNVYHIVTDSPLPTVRVFLDISGYVSRLNSTNDGNAYLGQLYVIVNGEVSIAGSGYLSSNGVDIALSTQDNVITFLYAATKRTGGLIFAQDTVVVRTAKDESTLKALPYHTKAIPVIDDTTDAAVGNTNPINTTGNIYYNGGSVFARQFVFHPDVSGLSMTYTNGVGEKTSLPKSNYVDGTVNGGNLTISGTYDSSGYSGPDTAGMNYTKFFNYETTVTSQPRTTGFAFLIDSIGVHLMDGSSMMARFGTTTGDGSVASPIGVLVLANYGYWDQQMDLYGYAGPDFDGLSSSFSAFYGSVDFVSSAYSSVMFSPQTTSSASAPGFGVVTALLSVAAVAYIAPRFKKDYRREYRE